jgi:hypothetical protein
MPLHTFKGILDNKQKGILARWNLSTVRLDAQFFIIIIIIV